jgi:hypothetical protein
MPTFHSYQLHLPAPRASSHSFVQGKAYAPLPRENADPSVQVYRWAMFPVDIAYTLPHKDPVHHSENIRFETLLRKACMQWQHVLRFILSPPSPATDLFTYTCMCSLPDVATPGSGITLAWQDAPPDKDRPYEAGRATLIPERAEGGVIWLKQVRIDLQRTPRVYHTLDAAAQEQQLFVTLLHELGHALGINHALHPASVMFHQNRFNSRFTREDEMLLQQIYG